MKILAIFDNGGETLDRYTVVTDQQGTRPIEYEMLGLDNGGDGYSQWCMGHYVPNAADKNAHLGKRVYFENLSAETQAHIAHRIFEDN